MATAIQMPSLSPTMKEGKIQQADTPLKTYNEPANRFVAGFIGMPPMNFFDGVVKALDARLVFQEGKRLPGTSKGGGGSGAGLM